MVILDKMARAPRKLSINFRGSGRVFSRPSKRLSMDFRAGLPPRRNTAGVRADLCCGKGLRVVAARDEGDGASGSMPAPALGGRPARSRHGDGRSRDRGCRIPGKFFRLNRPGMRLAHALTRRVVTSLCQPVRNVRERTRELAKFDYSVARYTDVLGGRDIVSVAVGDRSHRRGGFFLNAYQGSITCQLQFTRAAPRQAAT